MQHLYVHVPFCRRRCVYCDFAIAVRHAIPDEEFVQCILAELHMRRASESWTGGAPHTVYFGGGTPSLLGPAHLARIVQAAGPGRDAAITVEANPDDVTEQRVRGWIGAGVNRLSIGAQSFDDRVLQWMHRTHNATDTERAVRLAREAAIDNLSVDLIFGLPPELEHQWDRDLATALELEPSHMSIYGLTVESRTPLYRWMGRGTVRQVADERFEREFLAAHEALTSAGFEHYEISNYARPGFQSAHNSAHWSGASYVGLGPSAHSYERPVRRWNVREWAQYQRVVGLGGDPLGGSEVLDQRQLQVERVLLGLRTAHGVEIPELGTAPPWLDRAIDGGLARLEQGVLTLSPAGWLRMDDLAYRLTTFLECG